MLLPPRQRRQHVRVVRPMLDLGIGPVLLHGSAHGDVAGGAFVPRTVVDFGLLARPESQRVALAAKSPAQTRAVWIADFNEPSVLLGVPDWALREVAISSWFVHGS